jgi:hypothetical protein
MNGPIILNNARELLADEILSYREEKPELLKISPWLVMSLLQKAVRRGGSECAQRAATCCAAACVVSRLTRGDPRQPNAQADYGGLR